jgi:hypothetical protein
MSAVVPAKTTDPPADDVPGGRAEPLAVTPASC